MDSSASPRKPEGEILSVFEAFPDPWRSILGACDWTEKGFTDGVAAERWRLGQRRRGRRVESNGVVGQKNDQSDRSFASHSVGVGRERTTVGLDLPSSRPQVNCRRRQDFLWLRSTLHALPHPKAEFRRLVGFLGELMPVSRSIKIGVDAADDDDRG